MDFLGLPWATACGPGLGLGLAHRGDALGPRKNGRKKAHERRSPICNKKSRSRARQFDFFNVLNMYVSSKIAPSLETSSKFRLFIFTKINQTCAPVRSIRKILIITGRAVGRSSTLSARGRKTLQSLSLAGSRNRHVSRHPLRAAEVGPQVGGGGPGDEELPSRQESFCGGSVTRSWSGEREVRPRSGLFVVCQFRKYLRFNAGMYAPRLGATTACFFFFFLLTSGRLGQAIFSLPPCRSCEV